MAAVPEQTVGQLQLVGEGGPLGRQRHLRGHVCRAAGSASGVTCIERPTIPELTPRGLKDADAVAQALANELHGVADSEVSSSASLRARRTAEPIATALGTVAVFDGRLREKSYGAAEGRPRRWARS
jgi:broad specificity phosphatase PhoE